jgi:fatty acid desaturase
MLRRIKYRPACRAGVAPDYRMPEVTETPAAANPVYLKHKAQMDHVRRTLRDAVGAETFRRLNRPLPWLDALTVFGLLAIFAAVMTGLARVAFGPLWLALFVFQGFVLQWFLLVSHDLFVHRGSGGEFWSWIGSIILTAPRFSLPTGYEQAHLSHHRNIGTTLDTEAYKQDLDSRGRRLLFSTVLGVKLAQASRLGAEARRHYHEVNADNVKLQRRVRIERIVMRSWLVALIPLAILFPKPVLLGYVLPTLIMLPIVNTLRIIIEHADIDPDNPFYLGTFYRTGFLSRPLFLWDSGDCHLIHHAFPHMPWYHVGEALDLMRPTLLAHGIVERTSFIELLKGWYIDNYPHRTLWPLNTPQQNDAAAATSPAQ